MTIKVRRYTSYFYCAVFLAVRYTTPMREKLIIITSVAILSIALIVFLQKSDGAVRNAPTPGNTIVVLGDSLTVGIGDTDGDGWVPLVEAQLGRKITRIATPGETTAGGLARLDEVRALKPDTVIVFLGGNDALRRIPVADTFAHLQTIITTLQEEGILVVLVGVRGSFFGDRYEQEFKTLAEDTRAALVLNVLKDIFNNPDRMSPDRIHPNTEGYILIAKRITETLKPLISI